MGNLQRHKGTRPAWGSRSSPFVDHVFGSQRECHSICPVVVALGKVGDSTVLRDLLAILPMAGIPLRHLPFVAIAGLVGNRAEVFQRPETRDYLFGRYGPVMGRLKGKVP